MAFVHDNKVKELGRNGGIVDDIRWLALPRFGRIEARPFLVRGIEFRFALEHGIETLNRGDYDFRGRVDGIRFQPLDGIKRWELPRVVS